MSENKADILVIVEGAKTDVRLMERLFKLYKIDNRHQIVSYNTNIYALYNAVFIEVDDPNNIDLLLHLRSRESDPNKKAILSKTYVETLLIFDFDPHDPQYSDDKIREMAAFFTDSIEMGKLYINYPMVEAFYHMKSIPDEDYNSYTASMSELKSSMYKARVNKENRNGDYTKFAIDTDETSTIIRQNIDKAWHVWRGGGSVETTPPNSVAVLGAQLSNMKNKQEVAVLCTCIFYIVDYNPVLLDEKLFDE